MDTQIQFSLCENLSSKYGNHAETILKLVLIAMNKLAWEGLQYDENSWFTPETRPVRSEERT